MPVTNGFKRNLATLYSVFCVTVLCSKLECASYAIKSTALLHCSLLRYAATVTYVHSNRRLLFNKVQAECRYSTVEFPICKGAARGGGGHGATALLFDPNVLIM